MHLLEPRDGEPVVTLELPRSAVRALRDCYYIHGAPATFGYDGSLIDEIGFQLTAQSSDDLHTAIGGAAEFADNASEPYDGTYAHRQGRRAGMSDELTARLKAAMQKPTLIIELGTALFGNGPYVKLSRPGATSRSKPVQLVPTILQSGKHSEVLRMLAEMLEQEGR